MKEKWIVLQERFESLEQRERLLIAGALLALLFLLWDFGLTQPMKDEYQLLQARERVASQAITSSEAESQVLASLNKKDPNEAVKRELEKLNEEIEKLDQQLDELSSGLVSAKDFPLVMKDLLLASEGIELINLYTLPSEAIDIMEEGEEAQSNSDEISMNDFISDPVGDSEKGNIQLYRHNLNLRLQGSYQSVLKFVQTLEASNWQFYWESMEYEVRSYPDAKVSLNVFTMSADRGK